MTSTDLPPVHPPVDPELHAALAAALAAAFDDGEDVPTTVTPDMLAGLREETAAAAPSLAAIATEHGVTVRTVTVARSGSPDLRLLVAQPPNARPPTTRTANRTAWEARLGPLRGSAAVEPYAAPSRAADLGGLPPAFVDVGSVDTFRDEAVDYATRIWQAGGAAELHVWPGAYHCFEILAPGAAVTVAAVERRIDWLRRILRPA